MNAVLAVDANAISDFTIDPWSLLWAALSVLAGWVLSRFAKRAVARVLSGLAGVSEQLAHVIASAASYLVLFIGIGVALSFLGAQIQPVLATVIIIGIILALAVRGIADDFSAGIVIQSRKIVQPGDEIDALGFNGVVKEVNSRSVIIDTSDGRVVHLPNSEVLANPLVNDTENGARRSEIEVRVESTDVTAVCDRLLAVTRQTPGVLTVPEPKVHVTAVDPDRVTTVVRFWHEPSEGTGVVSKVIATIADSIDATLTVVSPRPKTPFTPSPRV